MMASRSRRQLPDIVSTPKHHGAGLPSDSRWLPDLTRPEEFQVFDMADFHELRDEDGDLYGLRISGDPGNRQLALSHWGLGRLDSFKRFAAQGFAACRSFGAKGLVASCCCRPSAPKTVNPELAFNRANATVPANCWSWGINTNTLLASGPKDVPMIPGMAIPSGRFARSMTIGGRRERRIGRSRAAVRLERFSLLGWSSGTYSRPIRRTDSRRRGTWASWMRARSDGERTRICPNGQDVRARTRDLGGPRAFPEQALPGNRDG